jgi:alpha-tubulin suppressor-like RCC1 family protein
MTAGRHSLGGFHVRRFVCVVTVVLVGTAGCDLGGGGDLPPFALLTTGANHSCALNPIGDLYCWGADSSGQLGLGGPSTTPRPNAALVTPLPRLVLVTSFSSHTCSIDFVNRKADCWGDNTSGQLGTADSLSRAIPTPVATAVSFATIAIGGKHTCGLVGADSTVACWGDNTFGQLGNNSNNPAVTPVTVDAGTVRFVSVASGGRHACALTPEGQAYCWGDNSEGQLGDGTTAPSNVPVPSAGALRFFRLVLGDAHTCGRTQASAVFCWGRGEEGQLGVSTPPETCGSTDCSTVPVQVTTTLQQITITAGAQHTCSISTARQAICWGRNTSGQLGTTTTALCNGIACSPTPIAVSGGIAFQSIVAGGSHTCAFANDASPYCWGANGSGQLGDGTTTNRSSPVRVLNP